MSKKNNWKIWGLVGTCLAGTVYTVVCLKGELPTLDEMADTGKVLLGIGQALVTGVVSSAVGSLKHHITLFLDNRKTQAEIEKRIAINSEADKFELTNHYEATSTPYQELSQKLLSSTPKGSSQLLDKWKEHISKVNHLVDDFIKLGRVPEEIQNNYCHLAQKYRKELNEKLSEDDYLKKLISNGYLFDELPKNLISGFIPAAEKSGEAQKKKGQHSRRNSDDSLEGPSTQWKLVV